MIPTKLRLSKIVTPFPVFEEHCDPNMVIALADDQGGTLDVKMLELLFLTCLRYKAKVARALKMQNYGSAKIFAKGCGEAITWECSSWDKSARILDTFSSVYTSQARPEFSQCCPHRLHNHE